MIAALFLTSTLAMLSGPDANGPRSGETVCLLDKQLHTFAANHNSHVAARLYADDFLFISSTGQQKRKADVLKEISSRATVLHCSETTDVQVRLLGTTAVLTGILHQQGTHQGVAFETHQLVTYTWVRNAGNWQLLSGHGSLLAL